jgi:UDP-N-acetylmuramyl pentapeptide phosphotransferase/UDP-N-acetylglucosamine-1-phosphate transferase
MLIYLLITVMLIATILIYFRIADRYNIIDKPNERSSHSYITLRGGGIIFPVAAMLWFVFFGFQQLWALAALVLIALISFLDDLQPLSGKVRMLVHVVAVSLLFYSMGIFGLAWYTIAGAYLLAVFWINAFNFMDGINAITPFYSLALLVTFWFLNREIRFFDGDLIVVIAISALIFSFFNARKKAKTFAGDVGSVSMAFLLCWMMIALILQTGRFEFILLFAVYGLDSIFTIIYRIIRRENIFQAHRSHLYQLLSNEMKWPHVQVAMIYAVAQLLINLVAISLIINDMMKIRVFILIVLALSGIYLSLRFSVSSKIQKI